ncbi:Fc.00g026140.m01.CDS01 [Cosmosporella sp. VM-42]
MLYRLWRRISPLFLLVVLRYLSAWPRRFLLLAFVWTLVDAFHVHRRLYLASQEHRAPVKSQSPVRMFIASLHWNNERILRDSWNKAVLDLVSAFGPSNIFVRVYESGSRGGSKDALGELDRSLDAMGAPRNVTLDMTSHADAMALPPLQPGK